MMIDARASQQNGSWREQGRHARDTGSYVPAGRAAAQGITHAAAAQSRYASSLALLVFHQTAGLARAGRVERVLALFDVLNDAVLVDHEGGAVGESVLFVKHAVFF